MSRAFGTADEAKAAESPVSYFPGKNGIGLMSKYGSADSCAKFNIVRKVYVADSLEDIAEGIDIESFVPVSSEILARTLGIFQRVYQDHQSEMIVFLGWNPKKKAYFLARPKCAVIGPGHLKYRKRKGRLVGTIHSHGSMGAFFSGTDDRNEKGDLHTSPGIYMVFGKVCTRPELVASVAGMGLREDIIKRLDLSKVIGTDIPDREYDWWMRDVQVLSEIQGKTEGWYVVDPEGDVIRWELLQEDAERYADPEDRVIEAGKRRGRASFMPTKSTVFDSPPKSSGSGWGGGWSDYWDSDWVWDDGLKMYVRRSERPKAPIGYRERYSGRYPFYEEDEYERVWDKKKGHYVWTLKSLDKKAEEEAGVDPDMGKIVEAVAKLVGKDAEVRDKFLDALYKELEYDNLDLVLGIMSRMGPAELLDVFFDTWAAEWMDESTLATVLVEGLAWLDETGQREVNERAGIALAPEEEEEEEEEEDWPEEEEEEESANEAIVRDAQPVVVIRSPKKEDKGCGSQSSVAAGSATTSPKGSPAKPLLKRSRPKSSS